MVPQRLLRLIVTALLALPLLCLADSADARRDGFGRTKSAERVPERPLGQKSEHGPVLIVISIAKQRISVYGSSGLIAQSAVSSGQAGFRTPTGVFTVIQKSRWHRSNIYSGAPMPFMQRITWSGVAMHAGVLPGYPASHGCIRLTHGFAAELWGMTKMGARVVVAPDDATAIDMVNPLLPVPTMTPAPAAAERQAEAPAVRSASLISTASAETASEATSAAPPVKLLNPVERAKLVRIQLTSNVAIAAKEAKAAVEMSAQKAAEANRAIAALRDAELAIAAASSRRDAVAKAAEAAKTPEAVERAKAALTEVEAKLVEVEKAAAEARLIESFKTPEAFAAAKAAWDAEKASEAMAAALKAAERGAEPISIFVSKKAGRVYVRQAWAQIHDAPVTFSGPDTPLGTHVYVAAEPKDEGMAMRWISLSLPPSAVSQEGRPSGRRGASERPAAAPASHSAHRRETGASVLERFELTEETKTFISDKLWLGASLIVSDEGISNETGKYTDFIVLTR